MQEPVFDNIKVCVSPVTVSGQIKSECKTETENSSIGSMFGVSGYAKVIDSAAANGKITFNGKIVYYAFYLDSEGKVKKIESSCDFSGLAEDENVTETTKFAVELCVLKTGADLSGETLSLSAVIGYNVKIYNDKDLSVLSGGEGLITQKADEEICKGYGVVSSVYPVSDEFETDYEIKEVLSQSANPVITSVQCGVGAIIVDGEAVLSMLTLKSGEKDDIKAEEKLIPFRVEIDYEEAVPTMQAVASVVLKSLKTDISVDGESNKSVVSVNINLEFTAQAYASETVSVIKDAYSLTHETEIIKDEFAFEKILCVCSCTSDITGKGVVEDIPIGAHIAAIFNPKAIITGKCVKEDKIQAEGVLLLSIILVDGENNFYLRKTETAFDELLDCAAEENVAVNLSVVPSSVSAKILSGTEVEIGAKLIFTSLMTKCKKAEFVSDVKVIKEKEQETAAISVYIPEKDEELWELSKRLNVCPDELLSINKDLNFPLSGDERIVVYRKK